MLLGSDPGVLSAGGRVVIKGGSNSRPNIILQQLQVKILDQFHFYRNI
jgi:hypothetical protein